MEHDEIKEKIDAYRDNELTATDRQEVAAHLESCGDCRVYYEELMKLSHLAFPRMASLPNDVFVQRVMTRIEQIEANREGTAKWGNIWQWFYPAFVAAALAGFLFIMIYPSHESSTNVETMLLANKPDNIPANFFVMNDNQKNESILSYISEDL